MSDIPFPKKVFAIGPMHNSILKNADEHIKLIFTRIDKLKSQKNGSPGFYQELENIFTEFVAVYEYDKTTAVLPEPIGTFKSSDDKKIWIERHLLAIEFEYHLGGILYNYHEWMFDNQQLLNLVENGFIPLPTWQDALVRYLKEIDY